MEQLRHEQKAAATFRPPTLDEFLEDIEARKGQTGAKTHDPNRLAAHLEQTGQENDPLELAVARQWALDTTGTFANCPPERAWELAFGEFGTWHDRGDGAGSKSAIKIILQLSSVAQVCLYH
jgi:hypothetical protein